MRLAPWGVSPGPGNDKGACAWIRIRLAHCELEQILNVLMNQYNSPWWQKVWLTRMGQKVIIKMSTNTGDEAVCMLNVCLGQDKVSTL